MMRKIINIFFVTPIVMLIVGTILLGAHTQLSMAETDIQDPSVEEPVEPEQPDDPIQTPDVVPTDTPEPTATPEPTPPPIPVESISLKYTLKSIYTDKVVSKKTAINDSEIFDLWIGDKLTISTTILPSDADQTLNYESSDTTVATVSAKGVVTVKNMGDTTISVSPVTNPDIKKSFYIHCYKEAIDVVADMGAVPDDGLSDLTPIKKALAQAQYLDSDSIMSITVPDGTYDVDGTLTAYSNTKLTLSDGAVIKRTTSAAAKTLLKSHVDATIKGYEQFVNFEMTGGTWDGQGDSSASSDIIYFGHGKNIAIENTTIKNTSGHHLIELAGIDTASVNNVILTGYVVPQKGDSYTSKKEAIQLDYCSLNSSSSMKPNDYTVCKNISITNCDISNYMCGIGAHDYTKGIYLSDITIKNNKFTNITNICVDARNFKNITVSNNTVSGFNEFLYAVNSTGTIKSNTVKSKSFSKLTTSLLNTANGIEFLNSTFTVSSNTLSGQKANGIYIGTGSEITVKNNKIKNSTKYGIYTYKATAKFATNTFSSNKKGIYHTDKDAVLKSSDDIRAYYVPLDTQYKYTGKKIKPITKISGLNKKYYSITYKKNKKRGTATVTIKGKGKVKKSNKLKFKIV